MYCTDEVDDEAAVGRPAGGAAEECFAVGAVVVGDGGEAGGLEDEVAGVGVRAAEAEDGTETRRLDVRLGGARVMQEARDEDDGERQQRRLHERFRGRRGGRSKKMLADVAWRKV